MIASGGCSEAVVMLGGNESGDEMLGSTVCALDQDHMDIMRMIVNVLQPRICQLIKSWLCLC